MKVAIIGTGYIAGRHADALTGLGVEIAGHVGSAADAAATRWGGRGFATTTDLLAAEHVDAAWICVPPDAHGDVELALIDRGVPFYVEKPIANDLDTARRIAAALRDGGPLACAGYYWRCMDVIPELRALLAETPPRLVRAAWHGLVPPAPWWRTQERSGGQVVEQATHLLDLTRHLLGEAEVCHAAADHTPRPEHPDLDVATVTAATLRFPSGPVAVLTATCVLHATVDASLEFHCDGRKLTLTTKQLRCEDAAGTRTTPVLRDPLAVADERFLAAVRDNDPSQLICDYADAVATQDLCCRVRDAAAVI